MTFPVIKTSFAGGELAPALWGHEDLQKLSAGATTCRNIYIGYRGGAYSRAGTKFVCVSKQNPLTGAAAPRLIGFEFSNSQTYVLEFGDQYIRFIFRGAPVVENGVVITGATQATPCQITAPAHGYSNGQWVVISGVTGMTQLNGKTFIVAGAATNTFTLTDLYGNSVNSTGYGLYTGGGTASRIYEIVSPYAAVDLPLLKFTQSADVISLTHPAYPPQDLSRLGATNWTIGPTAFSAGIAAPGNATATATVHPDHTLTPPTLPCAFAYVVTAVDPKTGQESVASPIANVTDSVDIAATAGSIIVDWDAVSGAQNYNIYRAPTSYNTDPGSTTVALPVPAGAIFGFIGSSFGNQFVDSNITANFSIVPPLHRDPFAPGQILSVTMGSSSADWTSATVSITSGTGSGFIGQAVIVNDTIVAVIVVNAGQLYQNTDTISFSGTGTSASATLVVGPQSGTYPGVVSYFQQRRVYADTLNKPDTYWASQPGAFTNFDTSIPVTDADAITATPWSEQVNGIQWMISMPLGLVTFTGNAVWQIGAPGSFASSPAPLTPANEVAVPQSSIGSSPIVPPIKINWDILYLQAHGATVRDLSYQVFFNNYVGTDISWQSSHLLIGHQIIQWAWCDEPYRVLWSVREDGFLLSLTYLKEQEVAAWARHDTQGQVRSVCSVTEIPVDALYMVVQRRGGTVFYIERMDNRIWNGVEDSWCVDCAINLALPTPAAIIGADKMSGSGAIFSTLPAIFAPGDVGKIIRMGGGIAVVTGYTGPGQVTGDWLFPCQIAAPNQSSAIPEVQAVGSWTLSPQVMTVSGLDHLIGQTVTGLADGVPITPRVVDATGTITLDLAASNVVVGLGFIAQLQSVYLDTGQPTIQGTRKAISSATVRIEASGAVQIGTNQIDASAVAPSPITATWTMPPAVVAAEALPTYQTASGAVVQPLFTGDVIARTPAAWQKPGQVAVQQSLPLPLNVLDFVPNVLPGDISEVQLSPRQQRGQQRQAA